MQGPPSGGPASIRDSHYVDGFCIARTAQSGVDDSASRHRGRLRALIVLGEALVTRSRALALYWVVFFAATNLFVVGYEEPTLRSQFGDSYDDYAAHVGRWIPTRPRARA